MEHKDIMLILIYVADKILVTPQRLVRAHFATNVYKHLPHVLPFPHSCARARTVVSEVFTETQSFADCKLHIRTRLNGLALSAIFGTLS